MQEKIDSGKLKVPVANADSNSSKQHSVQEEPPKPTTLVNQNSINHFFKNASASQKVSNKQTTVAKDNFNSISHKLQGLNKIEASWTNAAELVEHLKV